MFTRSFARRMPCALLTLLVLTLSACNGATIGSGLPGDTSETTVHTLLVDGLEREFIVYVPEQVRNMETAPVVFMLHGTSGDGAKFYNISRWREKADVEHFIAVFPSALVHCFLEDENMDGDFTDPGELHVTSKWASGAPGSSRLPLCSPSELATLTPTQLAEADHALADDVSFVRDMLDYLTANYNIDEKRIYASGFSNGGGMTSRLAVELSDRFAAFSASAGTLSVQPYPSDPRSFVLSIGSDDDGIRAGSGIASIPLTETLFLDIPELKVKGVDPMLAVLQLGDNHVYEDIDMAGKMTSHFTFSQSLNGANNSYTFIVIEDLGHQYPNGTNHPVILADYLWDFFKDKTLL